MMLFSLSCDSGDNEIIQFLLDMNLDSFARDSDESTFIHVAARHNQVDTIKRFANEKTCRAKVRNSHSNLALQTSLLRR